MFLSLLAASEITDDDFLDMDKVANRATMMANPNLIQEVRLLYTCRESILMTQGNRQS
jgi:hypothetical protein